MLQRADAPPSPVLRPEDAHVELNAFLHHSVWTVRSTAAPRVTLVDGFARSDTELPLFIVGHTVQRGPGAAAVNWILKAVLTVTAHRHLVQHDALAYFVVVNVREVFWRAFKVYIVDDINATWAVAGVIQISLPALQTLTHFSFLHEE